MTDPLRQTVISRPPEQARAWYVGAVALAVIAALFCALVAGVMMYQHFHYGHDDPMDNARFIALIQQRRAKPNDPALARRLQTLDLQLRDRFFSHRRRIATGAWLLLGGAVVLVIASKLASSLRRRLPAPLPIAPSAGTGASVGLTAEHWAVVALAVVVGGVAIGLISAPADPLAGRKHASTSTASAPLPDRAQYVKNWPRFRGPGGLGVAQGEDYPTDWDGPTGRNIRWKTPVALPGFNSPIVWGDHLFISGADKTRRMVYCYDARTGEQRWARPVNAPGAVRGQLKISEDTGYAAPTMATDGLRVYAIFATGDLVAFDFDGHQLWARAMPVKENAYGLASSLTTYGDTLIVQLDRGDIDSKLSMLYAIDGASGADRWKQPQPVGGSWCSPIIVRDKTHGDAIVTVAVGAVVAHDAKTGAILWFAKGIGDDPAPSPVAGDGRVYAISSNELMMAIRLGGRGDVTKTQVAWTFDDGYFPDIVSPLCDGPRVYMLDSSGVFTCLRAADGKKLYDPDVPGPFNASPTLVGQTIYLFNKKGRAILLKAGDTFEKLGEADLAEPIFASPAFVNGRIYVRTTRHLWCIEQGAQGPAAEAAPPEPGDGGKKELDL